MALWSSFNILSCHPCRLALCTPAPGSALPPQMSQAEPSRSPLPGIIRMFRLRASGLAAGSSVPIKVAFSPQLPA